MLSVPDTRSLSSAMVSAPQPSTPTAPGAAQHGSPFGAQHPGALPPPVMQIVAANYAEEMARQKPQQQQQVPGQQGPQQPEGRFKVRWAFASCLGTCTGCGGTRCTCSAPYIASK